MASLRRIDYYDDPDGPQANSLVPSVNVVVTDDAGRILMIRRTDNGNWVDCREFQRLARKLSRRGHSCASASWSAWKEVWPSAATVAGPYGSYGTRDPTPCPAFG